MIIFEIETGSLVQTKLGQNFNFITCLLLPDYLFILNKLDFLLFFFWKFGNIIILLSLSHKTIFEKKTTVTHVKRNEITSLCSCRYGFVVFSFNTWRLWFTNKNIHSHSITAPVQYFSTMFNCFATTSRQH